MAKKKRVEKKEPRAKTTYAVMFKCEGSRLTGVQKIVDAAFPGQQITVRKVDFEKSRADRLDAIGNDLGNSATDVEELKDELQDWLDGLPENLQQGSKADELNEAISELERIKDEIESIDVSTVSFPGMF